MHKRGWIVVGIALLAGLLLAARGSRLWAQSAKNTAEDAPTVNAGEPCTVYLRGDASGAAFHDRIPDLSLLIERHGTLEGMDQRWVVVKDGDRRYEIPISSIMLIEYGGKAGKKASSESPKLGASEGAGRPKLDLR